MFFEIVFVVAALTIVTLTFAVMMLPTEIDTQTDDKKMFWEGGF